MGKASLEGLDDNLLVIIHDTYNFRWYNAADTAGRNGLCNSKEGVKLDWHE